MPRTPFARRAFVGLNVLVALVLVAGAGVSTYLTWRLGRIDRIDADDALRPADAGEPVNILVVGSDSRERWWSHRRGGTSGRRRRRAASAPTPS